MSAPIPRIFRLTSGAEWRAAQAAGGTLPWNADDRRDGFFHLSARDQVVGTAERYYAEVPDLTVLELDAATLADKLKWESSRGGALFPHYYGAASVSAVTAAKPFDPKDFT